MPSLDSQERKKIIGVEDPIAAAHEGAAPSARYCGFRSIADSRGKEKTPGRLSRCGAEFHGVIERPNPAAAALLGVPRQALVGQRLAVFVDAEDAKAYAALIERAAAGAAARPCELRLLRAGAVPWWASVVVGAASAASGDALRHVILSDITFAKAAAVLVAAESQRTERALALNRVLLEVRDFDADDVPAYVRAVTEAVAHAIGAARVSLWAAESEGDVLQCRGRFDAASGVLEPSECIRVAEYPRYFAALQASDVLAADDAQADPRTNEFAPGYLRPMGITSMLDAPLRVGGRLAGVLCIEHRGSVRRWSAEEQSFAHALANIALHAIAHIERGLAVASHESSERQLRTLLDGMADRAWLKDRHGRYLALNRSEARALGVPIEQALGKTIQELWPDVPLQVAANEHARALTAIAPTRVERTAALSGEVWLEIVRSPVLGADGAVEGLVGIARDITERKLTESALVASEARFRALTEMSSDWYWETDAQGRYTMMVGRDGAGPHLRFGDAIGRGNGEIQALTGALREQLSPSLAEYERLRAERGGVRNALRKWTFPDGSMTFLRFSFEPMFDADGRFLGNRGVSSDVTQRERGAQALAQAHHQLEQAMSTSGIAFHEWNLSAHLMTIRGLPGPAGPSSLVERSKGEALALIHPDDAALVQRVYDEVRRGVVRSVEAEYRVRGAGGQWRWRRLQAQLVEVDPQSGVPLRATGTSSDIAAAKSVVGDAIKRVRTLWHELRPRVFDDLGLVVALRGLCAQTQAHSQMAVEFQMQGDAAAIATPVAEVLYRVCQEALTNAARHSQASRVEVHLHESGGKVSLRVHDNGVGFDAASQARATDRLGLVGMRERIRMLEGTLRIESTPAKGTRVCAEFSGARSAALAAT